MGDVIEVVQGQEWTHKVAISDVTVVFIGIPRVRISNGDREWWISRESLRKNYRPLTPTPSEERK